eukprot:scaffold477_cov355-Pinguiococcus_pyrenoidosus.AAC.1
MVQMDGVSEAAATKDDEADGDGKEKTVIVLAATNMPWDLDEALRRRLEKRIYIPLPREEGRRQLFKINMKEVELAKDVDIQALATATDGYSGADIANVCRTAAMMGVRRVMEAARKRGLNGIEVQRELMNNRDALADAAVSHTDFEEALDKVSRSVGGEDLQRYEDWMKEFGSA